MNKQLDVQSYGIGQPVRRVEDAAASITSTCRQRWRAHGKPWGLGSELFYPSGGPP